MDEQERAKQYRQWHFLDFLGVLVWVMNRGLRGRGLVEHTPPRLTGEPPLVELDRLVRLAALGKSPDAVLDREQLEEVGDLFQAVAIQDGSVSSEEEALMKQFLAAHAATGAKEIEVENFLAAFRNHHVSDAKLKETCHLLRTRLRSRATEQVVESLFRLARLHGFDQDEQHIVENIGEYLGLMSSEIRLAENASRKEVRK